MLSKQQGKAHMHPSSDVSIHCKITVGQATKAKLTWTIWPRTQMLWILHSCGSLHLTPAIDKNVCLKTNTSHIIITSMYFSIHVTELHQDINRPIGHFGPSLIVIIIVILPYQRLDCMQVYSVITPGISNEWSPSVSTHSLVLSHHDWPTKVTKVEKLMMQNGRDSHHEKRGSEPTESKNKPGMILSH